jgi:hypothetical protein
VADSRVDEILQRRGFQFVQAIVIAEFAKEMLKVHARGGERVGFDAAISKGSKVLVDDLAQCGSFGLRRRNGVAPTAHFSIGQQEREDVPSFGQFEPAAFE